MEPTTKPLINPSVVTRPVLDGEAVLVNLDTAACVALNRAGHVVRVW